MQNYFTVQSIYALRIIIAVICGIVIGYERENSLKMAGIPTHSIVALAASLMMIISKYGFYDILTQTGMSLDPSRIAAGVVSAIGFLGAGVIFTRKMNVSGLTTAAGLWATVGIGSAIGAGMYAIGICATLLVLILQLFYNRNNHIFNSPKIEHITLLINEDEDISGILNEIFTVKKIMISNVTVARVEHSMVEVKLWVKFPPSYDMGNTLALLKEHPEIQSIDI